MKVTRGMAKEYDRLDAIATKAHNSVRKAREQARRDARMLAIIRETQSPYPPHVTSWLSRKLEKRSSRITQAEVQSLFNLSAAADAPAL